MAKRQGLHVLRRMQATVGEGKVPSAEIADGFLILLAAILMIVPGFLTAGLALLLLLPPRPGPRAAIAPAPDPSRGRPRRGDPRSSP